MRKTKIICTMGPATEREGVLEALVENGMNVARFNFSHGSHAEQKVRMDRIKALRGEKDLPVAILLDTKGPEIRLKNFKDGSAQLKRGQVFTLTTGDEPGNASFVGITCPQLHEDVAPGTAILLDDGLISMEVTSISGTDIICEVQNDGVISNHKGINVPGVHLSLPYMSEKDREDILFGIEQNVDIIAASFVRTRDDVLEIRHLLEQNGGNGISIIAKIENDEGVQHIDEIIEVSDGIMIARGDMGVEIPMEEVPVIQKMIIKKVYAAGKQVITATQMLDSMMKNPRPTRAEVTDGCLPRRIAPGHGAHRNTHRGGYRLPQAVFQQRARRKSRYHGCDLPRHMHNRPRPGCPGHPHRHKIRPGGAHDLPLPSTVGYHRLHDEPAGCKTVKSLMGRNADPDGGAPPRSGSV